MTERTATRLQALEALFLVTDQREPPKDWRKAFDEVELKLIDDLIKRPKDPSSADEGPDLVREILGICIAGEINMTYKYHSQVHRLNLARNAGRGYGLQDLVEDFAKAMNYSK